MDLPPPYFHHQPRSGNFLLAPDFDRASSNVHRIPPPQPHPPHNHFRPPLHAEHHHPSPHFNAFLMQHHVIDRRHLYESHYPRLDTFFNHEHLSRPLPPPPRENMRLPLLHECCRPSPFLRLETPPHGCEDRDKYEFPQNCNRNPRCGPRERQHRFTDGRQNCCDRSRFAAVYDRGCLLDKDMDYAERRMEGGIIERGYEIYDDDQWRDARWSCNIKARGYELGIERYYHENGWNDGTNLYSEVSIDERGGKFCCKNKALCQSWNRQEEIVEGNSSWDSLSLRHRLGMREDKGMLIRSGKKTRLLNKLPWQRRRMGEDRGLSVRFNKKKKISPSKHVRRNIGNRNVTGLLDRCKKKRKSMDNNSGQRIGVLEENELFIGSRKKVKLLSKYALDRIELRKDCTRDGGDSKDPHLSDALSGFSVRIEEKEGPERMEAGNKNNREGQSLVEPAVSSKSTPVATASLPSLPKLECGLILVDESKRIVDNISGSPLAGSGKDVTEPNPKHGLVLESELQGTYSEFLGKSALSQSAYVSDATDLGENAIKHALNVEVPNLVSPCSVSRLENRKVGSLLLPESIMLKGNDCRVSNLSSSGISNLSPFSVEDVIADSSNHTEGLVTLAEDDGYACQLITDEVDCFTHGKLSAMWSTENSCIHNLASAAGTENSEVEPLCHDGMVDDTNEDHENSFVSGHLKAIVFLEGHNVVGLPRCEEYDISVVGSEVNQFSLSSEDAEAVPKNPGNAIITQSGTSDGYSVEFLRNQVVAPEHDTSAEDFRYTGGDAVTSCSDGIINAPGTANFLLAGCFLPANIDDVRGSNFSGELLASGLQNRSCIFSPECHSDLRLSTKVEDQTCNSENEMIHDRGILCNVKSMPIDSTSSLGKSPDYAASDNLQVNAKISRYSCEDGEKVMKKVNERVTLSKKPTWAVPKVVPSHYSLKYSSASKSNFTHAPKPMTWHRNVNSAAVTIEPSNLPTAPGMRIGRTMQNTYIRKGNTLLRKPSNYRVTPPAFHGSGLSNIQASSGENVAAGAYTLQSVDPANGSDMPNALPLSRSGDSLNCSTSSSNNGSSLAVNSPGDGLPCKTVDALEESIKNTMVPCQAGSLNNSDGQHTLDEGYSAKKIMYIKRTSYQLVATSNPSDMSIAGVDHVQPSSLSIGYYKRKKNQLIRAGSANCVKKADTTAILNRVLAGPSLTRRANRRQSYFPMPGEMKKHHKEMIAAKRRDRMIQHGAYLEKINMILQQMVLCGEETLSFPPMKRRDCSQVRRLASIYHLQSGCQGSGKNRFVTVVRTPRTCMPSFRDELLLKKLIWGDDEDAGFSVNGKLETSGAGLRAHNPSRTLSSEKTSSKKSEANPAREELNDKNLGKVGSYASQPLSFLSSGVMAGEMFEPKLSESDERNGTSVEATPLPISVDYGAFEMHTTGFGSKMMAKMGFVDGGGLGKDGQGIAKPIEVLPRPKLLGLGSSPIKLFQQYQPISGGATDSSSSPKSKPSKQYQPMARGGGTTATKGVSLSNHEILGSFEMHTKGFGSKMMAKMGFVEGSGLGRYSQGIVNPLVAVRRPKARGLGASRRNK